MAGWFEKIRAVFSSTLPSNHASESGNKKCAEIHNINPANNLKVSAMDGVELIKKYEGFVSKAYKCPAGVCTIGYGSTSWADGMPIKMGQTITQEKAEALLVDYLNKNVRQAHFRAAKGSQSDNFLCFGVCIHRGTLVR